MRRIAPLIAAATLLAFIPTDASAWTCRASSATGAWGVGWAAYRAAANQIALTNCAVRTPRGVMCWTNYCRR